MCTNSFHTFAYFEQVFIRKLKMWPLIYYTQRWEFKKITISREKVRKLAFDQKKKKKRKHAKEKK